MVFVQDIALPGPAFAMTHLTEAVSVAVADRVSEKIAARPGEH
jgi:hypothetical protein